MINLSFNYFGFKKSFLKFCQSHNLFVIIINAFGNNNNFIIIIIKPVNNSNAPAGKFFPRFENSQNISINFFAIWRFSIGYEAIINHINKAVLGMPGANWPVYFGQDR